MAAGPAAISPLRWRGHVLCFPTLHFAIGSLPHNLCVSSSGQGDENIGILQPYATNTVQTIPQEKEKKAKVKEDMMPPASQRILPGGEGVQSKNWDVHDFITQCGQGLKHMGAIKDVHMTLSI